PFFSRLSYASVRKNELGGRLRSPHGSARGEEWILKRVQDDGGGGGGRVESHRQISSLSKYVILNLFQDPFFRIVRSMRFREKQPCVYILVSGHYGTIYAGVTSDLLGRMWQHREGATPGFASKYKVYRLVRFELFADMERAILREKQLKRWHRQWKINLINDGNPEWRDLAVGFGLPPLAPNVGRDGS
ncbi:MAG: putative endonuclease, partial [Novosphingobium sp.]|nr:putative endonuclease [Novosphingobium sp.]